MSLEGNRRRGNEKRERKPFSLSESCDNGRESFCWDGAPGGSTDGLSFLDSFRTRERQFSRRTSLDRRGVTEDRSIGLLGRHELYVSSLAIELSG